MSMLPPRFVADSMARLFAATTLPRPRPALRFPEIAGRTTTIAIPTRHGSTMATVYHPEPTGRRPAVYVNVHGGGFVIGHREQDDPWCRFLAAHAGVVVINTDYVLAPQRRFPAPAEQIYDVLQWVSSPDRDWDGAELCVGGQSAGGNLAAAAARQTIAFGGPQIKLQVLHYAVLDLVTKTEHKATPAKGAAVLRPWKCEIFETAYIPDSSQRRDRLASPAWGSNGDGLAGIAPALIVAAGLDRLRDEAAAYARKLAAVGALAEYHEVGGVDHGYNIIGDGPDAGDVTRQVYTLIAQHVARATAPGRL
jgi:acetyl esterase/lipase